MIDLGSAGFLPVRLVVQANAKDLVRVRNDRQPGEAGKRLGGCLGLRIRDAGEPAGNGGPEIGITGGEHGADIEEIVALDEAPGGPSVDRNS